MKTEYRTYTIETDRRNPYAQKGEVEFMYYPTAQGVQHDADQDGEDLVYCGNCKWVDSLEEAQAAIDDLIIEEQEKEIIGLRESLKSILGHIENGYLVRDTSKDHEPGWAMKQLPFLNDLGKANKLINS